MPSERAFDRAATIRLLALATGLLACVGVFLASMLVLRLDRLRGELRGALEACTCCEEPAP